MRWEDCFALRSGRRIRVRVCGRLGMCILLEWDEQRVSLQCTEYIRRD